MKIFKGISAVLVSVALAACGGGGKGSASSTTTDTGAAKVEVLTSATSAGSAGDEVQITAFVKDANNNALTDTAVAFSTDTGTLSSVSATTGTSGIATATFSAGNDHSNRTATITVTSGSVAGSVTLPVQGTKLSFAGATTVPLSTNTTLSFTATDSKGSPIAGAPLTVTSSLNNGVSSSAGTTDSSGQLSVTYAATNAGSDTVSVQGIGASLSTVIVVSGEDFAFTSPVASTSVPVGQTQAVKVRYRKNGVAQVGQTVNFAATVGTLSAASAVTDGNGEATVNVSSTFAGSSTLSASIAAAGAQATLPMNFVATTPAKLVLQVSPTALAPNPTGSTNNQATVVATVKDANDNPVSGVTVNFSQTADPSGGLLQQASAQTDSSGQASVKYQSGPSSTASDGVVLKATVASSPAVFSSAALTVNQTAVFIVLGTGNTITNFNDDTYEKTWTATVTDANGVRVSGIPLTIKVIPTTFGKGALVWNSKIWTYGTHLQCPNEDANTNGILDAGEDINGDGALTPGNVVSLAASTVTTDANGSATLKLRYPESVASWIDVRLTATAVVSGTESRSFREFPLDVLSSDYTSETVPPAGRLSPFGTDASTCTNAN